MPLPLSAVLLLGGLGHCCSLSSSLDDAAVLAQTLLHRQRLRERQKRQPVLLRQVRQVPFFAPQLPPEQGPYYAAPQVPQQQAPYYPPAPQQPMPYYQPQSQPYYPIQSGSYYPQGSYYPPSSYQVLPPYSPIQPQQMPYPVQQPVTYSAPAVPEKQAAAPAPAPTPSPGPWVWVGPPRPASYKPDRLEIVKSEKSFFEKHPRTFDLVHFVPNTKTHCVQGERSYTIMALARLQLSPLAFQYANMSVEEGACTETSQYLRGPDYNPCFPKAFVYHFLAQRWQQVVMNEISESVFGFAKQKIDNAEEAWKEYVAEKDDTTMHAAEEEVEAICDNGRMMAETFGLPVAAEPFSIQPRGGEYCLQGSKSYLETVLEQLNSTDKYNGSKVQEKACSMHGFKTGPKEPRCLPHASIYLPHKNALVLSSMGAEGASWEDQALAAAQLHLDATCDGGATAYNISNLLHKKQERAEARARRIQEDAEEKANSNFYMFDEKLYACWQGPKYRLENVKNYLRGYGMPEVFFARRLKIYGGTCDNQCMINGWVERKGCIRHVRQCRHPDIYTVDNFLHKIDSLVPMLQASRSKIEEMIDGSDLETSCHRGNATGKRTVLHRQPASSNVKWANFSKELEEALKQVR